MAGYKRKRKGKKGAAAKKQKKEEPTKESTSSEAVPTDDGAEDEGPSNAEGTETSSDSSWENAKSVYDFTVNTIRGESVSLEKYKDCVLLIVNVASRCGYTSKNYAELVKMDEKYREQGLRILAFPCNQFSHQEPGDADKICAFVEKKNVKFDMFEKIEVNGKNAIPLYKYLKSKIQDDKSGSNIKWNFVKFLVDKKGIPVRRYASGKLTEIIPDIEKYLAE